ncbi:MULTISPECIES: filamentous hemagglutinin N-terminal domain-containing protein [unclassified Polaromonas]|uniref:two-partner secretion domain-containing protein n=1 Tax=unclassified Polaromonas TaxID=2638319 RepID=UPI000F08B3FC|nr:MULTISPECIES: filamentous hemagglutinin N-terminal domain-containing protein [unclassified Polaromonas]AYQ29893.1 filamentous hemagglutinin N-terminal domain-containing protein [Polaromonas sp. SP1]QGJ18994.1 filamentous hemagglutinin N-terminal domain-containing protein [Polaromonas sp. Pch-P]
MKSHASMNRIYRLVWNTALSLWVAVAENAKGRGKGSPVPGGLAPAALQAGGFRLNTACRAALVLVAALAAPAHEALAANAADASVSAGAGSVSTLGNTTTIHQASQRMAIDWTSLSTAAQEALIFNQPNAAAIALNRITGSSPSELLGSLTANGQVFILNPNGVLFGAGSQVNVGGLVASTLSMSNADFMAGNHVFTGSGGSVVNQGTLNAAPGGYLALLAPEVRNEGVMTASLGTALLAAGNKVTLNIDNGSLLGYSIDQGAINALAENRQLIQANGGQVLLSARAFDALSSGVVNNAGIVEAKTLNASKGRIALEGDFIVQAGTLDASGAEGGRIDLKGRAILDAGTANASGAAGEGGSIAYRATQAIVQTASANLKADGATQGGAISLQGDESFFSSGTLSATGQRGGTIDTLGNRVSLAAARLDASGSERGGLIRVGGGFQGRDAGVMNAQTTFVNGATTLKANGANGEIVVWSDGQTDYYGSASATGAGRIEVSGKGQLTYGGQADAGVGGTLLLDPANIIISDTAGPAAYALVDPHATPGNQFGANTTLLGTTTNGVFTENGKAVITVTTDSLAASNAGAVYLFDTTTGALVSTMTGSRANDRVGTSATALSNGNYVVRSQFWSNGAVAAAGAATWGSAATGINGVVSTANSLYGTTANDNVGNREVIALTNGNYVVRSSIWDNGAIADAGAATWGNGATGTAGAVSAANSLVGSTASDNVGLFGVTPLSNGNYVVRNPNWDNGAVVNAGSATWGNGTTGVSGAITAANSLVGSTLNDNVGGTITALTNGNYVVSSTQWDTGGLLNAGAITWGNGATGTSGVVSAANSLVGTSNNDLTVAAIALSNGNYVVNAPNWSSGGVRVGATIWGNGSTGLTGNITLANSLHGTHDGDYIGSVVTALPNGNYVVSNRLWDNGAISNAGAVVWANGATGITGDISTANSLYGTQASDQVGSGNGTGVTVLSNGNYVVSSPVWDNGAIADAGAATWVNGATGLVGPVSAANSFVGLQANDAVGNYGITALTNGNYVVRSPLWDSGALVNVGAITWGNGSTGLVGSINAGNSLLGSSASDFLGSDGVTALANGNYVVRSSQWDNGGVVDAGAVTWGNGSTGTTGVVGAANSLVGSQTNDKVGATGVTALATGDYVVSSSRWDNGALTDAGAVTWGSGAGGVSGAVNSLNSLVGTAANDRVGFKAVDSSTGLDISAVTPLGNGNYLVASPNAGGNNGQVLMGTPRGISYANGTGQTMSFNPSALSATLAGGTAVTLQASNDITVNSNINVAGTAGGALNLQAGRNINLNSVINTANGAFTASAGDAGALPADRQAGAAGINFGAGSAINAGTGVVTLRVNGVWVGGTPLPVATSTSGGELMAQYSAVLQGMQAEQGENLLNPRQQRSVGDRPEGTATRVEGCGVRMPVGFDADEC